MAKNTEKSERDLSNEAIIAVLSRKKKCAKCGLELPSDGDSKHCDECQEKRNSTAMRWIEAGISFIGGFFLGYNTAKAISELGSSTSLEEKSDEELASEYEEKRLSWAKDGDTATRNQMYRIDREMINRANEKHERENPDAKPIHHEHGWYLPSDD